MRSLIVDDEESARARLSRLLAAHPDIHVIGEAGDGLEAMQKIESLRPELLFLDIELPVLTGFEILQAVQPKTSVPLVIFVTGYDQHALAAFEANALSYLLKPVRPERLAQAVEHARKLIAVSGAAESEQERVLHIARESPRPLRHVVGRKRDRLILLAPHDIFWFQVEDRIVKARTETETFWVNYQLGELEANLPEGQFFRARREVLVNVGKIKEIRPYVKSGFLLIMSDPANTEIAASARQAHAFRRQVRGL